MFAPLLLLTPHKHAPCHLRRENSLGQVNLNLNDLNIFASRPQPLEGLTTNWNLTVAKTRARWLLEGAFGAPAQEEKEEETH